LISRKRASRTIALKLMPRSAAIARAARHVFSSRVRLTVFMIYKVPLFLCAPSSAFWPSPSNLKELPPRSALGLRRPLFLLTLGLRFGSSSQQGKHVVTFAGQAKTLQQFYNIQVEGPRAVFDPPRPISHESNREALLRRQNYFGPIVVRRR